MSLSAVWLELTLDDVVWCATPSPLPLCHGCAKPMGPDRRDHRASDEPFVGCSRLPWSMTAAACDFRPDAPEQDSRIEPDGRPRWRPFDLAPARRAEAQPSRERHRDEGSHAGRFRGRDYAAARDGKVAANVPCPPGAPPPVRHCRRSGGQGARSAPWAKAVYDRSCCCWRSPGSRRARQAGSGTTTPAEAWAKPAEHLPTEHRCPVDGEVFSGWPYDDVIITRLHGRNASR